jgi:hypothetical protein
MSLLEMCDAQSDTHQTMNRETMVPKLVVSCANSNYIVVIFITKEEGDKSRRGIMVAINYVKSASRY